MTTRLPASLPKQQRRRQKKNTIITTQVFSPLPFHAWVLPAQQTTGHALSPPLSRHAHAHLGLLLIFCPSFPTSTLGTQISTLRQFRAGRDTGPTYPRMRSWEWSNYTNTSTYESYAAESFFPQGRPPNGSYSLSTHCSPDNHFLVGWTPYVVQACPANDTRSPTHTHTMSHQINPSLLLPHRILAYIFP